METKVISKGAYKLKMAMLTLLKSYDYQNISIHQITNLAKMSRRSFYLYYENKQQLFEELLGDFIEYYLNPFLSNDHKQSFKDKIQTVIITIDQHYDSAVALFKESNPNVATKLIATVLNNHINQNQHGFFILQFNNRALQNYYVDIVAANLVSSICYMLQTYGLSVDERLNNICYVCNEISYFYNTNHNDS